MADLFSLFGTGIQLVGGLTQATGQYEAGQAEEAYQNYNAEIDELNAQLAFDTRDDILTQGVLALGQQQEEVGQIVADQIVKMAGSGFTIDSASEEIESTLILGERDRDQLRKSIEDAAFSAELEGLGLQQQAQGRRFAGRSAARAGETEALTTTLGTVANTFDRLNKSGFFS